MQVAAAVIAIQPLEKRMPAARKHAANCSSCNLRELCLPGALDAEDLGISPEYSPDLDQVRMPSALPWRLLRWIRYHSCATNCRQMDA